MNKKSASTTNFETNDSKEIHKLLDQGVEYSKAGQFDEALECFNRVLDIKPKDADALHLSGVVAANQKRFAVAKTLIQKAIEQKPFEAVYHLNLGNTLLDEGQIEQAMQSFSEALRLRPSDTDILGKLAISCDRRYAQATDFYNTNKFEEADAACRQILDVRPDRADAWHLWGVVASAGDKSYKGIERIHRAIAMAPNDVRYHNSLGVLLSKEGRYDIAIECFRRALSLDEDLIDANFNLSLALKAQGKLEAAIVSLQKVINLNPDYVTAYRILASILREIGRYDEAMTAARKATELGPEDALAFNELALLLRSLSHISEAVKACEKSLELYPDEATTHNTMGILLKEQGQLTEAYASFRKALELDPSKAIIHSNLLLNLHYNDPYDATLLFQEHIQWARVHSASESEILPFESINRNPDKRLRVGYVSADLKTHSVCHFFEPLLIARDTGAFEVFCYSNSLTGDSTTERLKSLADKWREIASLDDDSAASLIRSDAIDILVDLSGHTRHNRLPLFTRRPAPIQVTYIGYPNTTGIEQMDYRFTDEWADPMGESEKYYTEGLVRLQQGFLCYQPLPSYPDIGPLPLLSQKHLTFGCFNNLAKVSPTIISLWARIMSVFPDSRLLLKSKPLVDSEIRNRMKERFKTHGIDDKRLELLGWTEEKSDHMNLYNKVDIALDTFPYNGTTTTCEALWMGVPVITLAGSFHLSRVGLSLLSSAGLSEMVAKSPQEYIDKVVELASDPNRLANLRASLREQLQASPLTDAERITRSIEAAYRRMWQDYCSTDKPNIN